MLQPLNFHNRFALVLMKCENDVDKEWAGIVLNHLWDRSKFNICVDGAANQLRNFACLKPPNLLGSDCAGITEENLKWMREHSVKILDQDVDQDSTETNASDFSKLLHVLTSKEFAEQAPHLMAIYAIGGDFTSGGLGRELGNIDALYMAMFLYNIPVYLLHEGCITAILPAGNHKISALRNCTGRSCHLISLGPSCQTCHSCGLKWNLGKYG